MPGRRRALLAAGLWAIAPSAGARLQTLPPSAALRPFAQRPAEAARPASAAEHERRMRERQALLAAGEASLARGDVNGALAAFERAASMLHAPDTEMSLVRAHMQAGEYRRAVSFGAHTAGAHRQEVGGVVLYAWLLALGGQEAVARRVLDGAASLLSTDARLREAYQLLLDPSKVPREALLAPPMRLAPYSVGLDVPVRMRVAASGLLVDGGRRALVPLPALARTRTLRLRNGLGRVTSAGVERRVTALGVALLKLEPALPGNVPAVPADRDPFPGSPGHVVEFAASATAAPAWPRLRSGFHGMPDGDAGLRRLGIEMPPGPRGGPVFDARGRLAGIAVADAGSRDWLLPVSRLRRDAGDLLGDAVPSAPAAPAERAAADEVYERALGVTLQLIVES